MFKYSAPAFYTVMLADSVYKTLPPGATVVPIIGTSDQTHISNFSGDNKAWPVYITLRNFPSAQRNGPGSMAVLLLALLPVLTKFSKSTKADQYQRQVNADTLQDVFEFIFAPLQHAALDGVPIDCNYWKVGRCFPILSAWVADYMENVTLHGLKSNACPTCEVPAEGLGTYIKNYRARDYARYERYEYEYNQFPGSNSDGTHTKFQCIGINMGQNVFCGLHRVSVPDLHTPDMLHTVYLGLFKHMMDWIQAFLKKHG